MKRVELPGTGVHISQAVFGTSRLGGTVERYDKREGIRILQRAADAGITTFDTADLYAQGNSEKLLGQALRGRRDEVVLATKGGYVCSGKMKLLSRLKPLVRKFIKRRGGLAKVAGKVRGSAISQDFSAEYLTKAVENSLRRLGTDRIDIYQLHSPDRETLERGEVFETLQRLKEAGKIRSFGASLLSWDHLQPCLGTGLSFVQIEADLLAGMGRKKEVEDAAQEGVLVVARQPFASGLLGRDPATWEAGDFDGDEGRLQRARERAAALRELGDSFELIVRYLVHHAEFPAFLFATTRMGHLERNLAAINGGALEPVEREVFSA